MSGLSISIPKASQEGPVVLVADDLPLRPTQFVDKGLQMRARRHATIVT